jgi:DNA polymerase elongation subunit (family B)
MSYKWRFYNNYAVNAAGVDVYFDGYTFVEDPNGEYNSVSGRNYSKHPIDCASVYNKLEIYSKHEIDRNVKILSFDIECYNDIIFMICIVVQEPKRTLSGGAPAQLLDSQSVRRYTLKQNFSDFFAIIEKERPDVITGYNICGYDFPKIIEQIGRSCYNIVSLEWESSAFGKNTIKYIDFPFAVVVDLYLVIRRDYILESYSLNEVSKHFLNESKYDLTYKQMFKLYEQNSLAEIEKYCLQDTQLVVNLFNKMNVWIGLCELSKLTHTPIEDLYTRGQTYRLKNMYQYEFLQRKYVFDYNGSNLKYDEKLVGALVIDGKPGLYGESFIVDFNSLYPNIIVNEGICYSKQHIVANIVKELIDKRKHIKRLYAQEPEGVMKIVYDKRQWAYKILANSIYGAFGAKGVLYKPEIAQLITRVGRENLITAKSVIESYKGCRVFYGDTDSCMVEYDSVEYDTSAKLNSLLPDIIQSVYSKTNILLEMENKFKSFLLVSKKKYIAKRDNGSIYNRGLSVQRSFCRFSRELLKQTSVMLLNGEDPRAYIDEQIKDLLAGKIGKEKLIMKTNLKDEYDNVCANSIFQSSIKDHSARLAPGFQQTVEYYYTYPRAEDLAGDHTRKDKMGYCYSLEADNIDYILYLRQLKQIDTVLDLVYDGNVIQKYIKNKNIVRELKIKIYMNRNGYIFLDTPKYVTDEVGLKNGYMKLEDKNALTREWVKNKYNKSNPVHKSMIKYI